jgi:hypothetical protein
MYKLLSGITLLALIPTLSFAHGVGEIYSLPIPIDYYLYSSAIAVFFSFFLITYFPKVIAGYKQKEINLKPEVERILKSLLLFLFTLTSLTGIFGTVNISKNFSVIFFWIYFIIGMNILSFIFGGIWEKVNPWKFLAKEVLKLKEGTYKTPVWVPLVLLYAYYWLELVSGFSFKPSGVGYMILVYSVINIIGYKLFSDWFSKGELFSITYNFVSKFSITKINNHEEKKEEYFNNIIPSFLFVMILLAGISFDSLKETLLWFNLTDILGVEFQSKLTDSIGLIAAILPFSLLLLLSIYSAKAVLKLKATFTELIKLYLPGLSPIVFGYFVAHYFSVFIVSIPIFLPTLLDPFGFGWNLFGINELRFAPLILGAKYIWFIEIFFILFGHILAVIFTNHITKKCFPEQHGLKTIDLFLLPLMVAYTVITLWFISLPLVSL